MAGFSAEFQNVNATVLKAPEVVDCSPAIHVASGLAESIQENISVGSISIV